jgi:hypothetical protein
VGEPSLSLRKKKTINNEITKRNQLQNVHFSPAAATTAARTIAVEGAEFKCIVIRRRIDPETTKAA